MSKFIRHLVLTVAIISVIALVGCASTNVPVETDSATADTEATAMDTKSERAPLASTEGSKIAVITPYLAQPGTQFYLEGFEAAAAEKGWEVNVIDTAGDVAAVISRIEDVVNQG
ncbi:MAG TPA: hypothetical protein P5121_07160, partial [Caldilineaceae bacterium]|nr:hypothetical protein [Caldilineaceae bacterium]